MISQVNPPQRSNGNDDEKWMRYALTLAETAAAQQEVPVGAVLVANQRLIATGFNCPLGTLDPTAHAEINALRSGAKVLANYRLVNTTLYVTLEPCLMCAGAIVHARIDRLVFAATDKKGGAIVSCEKTLDKDFLNHRVSYQGGLFAEEASQLLKQFFLVRR